VKNMSFCGVCHHRVFGMDKHIKTEEHKCNLRQDNNEKRVYNKRALGKRAGAGQAKSESVTKNESG